MNNSIVIIGLGQLGRVFAGGFLRAGYSVVPVNRDTDVDIVAARHPEPALVLVAVAEPDLHTVLAALPPQWKTRIGLIQNELLPRDWTQHSISHPTVIPVWFEKKKGSDAKPLIPSPVSGPASETVLAALKAIDIPCREIASSQDLTYELVRKNVYILTTNIAGLRTGGTVGELWRQQRSFAHSVAQEVVQIQDWLTGERNPLERLIEGMEEAIEADPTHLCTGRSAPARLARALQHADEAKLAVPVLRQIQQATR
ncbi:MAG: hypothetical protein K8H84_02330 [Sulfuricella denitrificans]|nr:hypothetical protein [Sulfuricella denitrificans]